MDKPAFPRVSFQLPNGEIEWGVEGMTLREYYIGQALAGFCANPTVDVDVIDFGPIARSCISVADTTMAVMDKKKEGA